MAIQRFIEGSSFESYCHDDVLRSAVERKLTIIGRMMHCVLNMQPDLSSAEAQSIIQYSNHILHNYNQVNHATVWDIITTKLPALIRQTKSLLSSSEQA